MEEELNYKIEKLRRQVEEFEDESDVENLPKWKATFDELNSVKLKVHQLGIFSENEEFDEIKTEDLKYLLVAFYQAEILQKFMENRETSLKFALHFYSEFFKMLDKYDYLSREKKQAYKKLVKKEDDEEEKGAKKKMPSMEELNLERQQKIEGYRYKKNLSEKLKVDSL